MNHSPELRIWDVLVISPDGKCHLLGSVGASLGSLATTGNYGVYGLESFHQAAMPGRLFAAQKYVKLCMHQLWDITSVLSSRVVENFHPNRKVLESLGDFLNGSNAKIPTQISFPFFQDDFMKPQPPRIFIGIFSSKLNGFAK